jgi:hypothetical protein
VIPDRQRFVALAEGLKIQDFSKALSVRSTANESLLPLVDQDVSNGGLASRSQLATHGGIPRCQVMEVLPASFGGEQGL